MKIVIIGGTGLIGSKLVKRLGNAGHHVVAASPSSGVNTITGEGLKEVLEGAELVIDVANSPSFEDKAVMSFFETAGKNLLSAAKAAGIKHHIALSVVGTDRLQASGYFRAKQVQENLIRSSGIPYTIVHATQFFEFVPAIAQGATTGNEARLSSALIQPISSDDVVAAIADIAMAKPLNNTIEIGGPEKIRLDKLIEKFFGITGDTRNVITDDHALYFGVELNDQSLTTGDNARLGTDHYETWLKRSLLAATAK